VSERATGDPLRPPSERVSPRAIRYWTARALVPWVVIVALQVVWLWSTDEGRTGPHHVFILLSVVVAIAYAAIMPRWRYRVHRWELAEHAVYTQTGWLDQERRIAPLSRIQTVDTERGPLEQLFGLANVTVTTASAAGPLRIHGLDRDDADRLAARLTAVTDASTGDAT
jgi:membrane protein YdbS with pleckstrin-like domain